MSVTDVGHLRSAEGEDKMALAANREARSPSRSRASTWTGSSRIAEGNGKAAPQGAGSDATIGAFLRDPTEGIVPFDMGSSMRGIAPRNALATPS